MVWADLKRYIASKMCIDLDQIKQAIAEFSSTLTPSKCRQYIHHLKEVQIV